jgi:hypothetical protein
VRFHSGQRRIQNLEPYECKGCRQKQWSPAQALLECEEVDVFSTLAKNSARDASEGTGSTKKG